MKDEKKEGRVISDQFHVTSLLVYVSTCLLVYLSTCFLVYLSTCLLAYLFMPLPLHRDCAQQFTNHIIRLDAFRQAVKIQ